MAHRGEKDPVRVAAGLKASVHNPNVSQEAKDNATERLHEIEASLDETSQQSGKEKSHGLRSGEESKPSDEEHNRSMGGYKATLKNPKVSEEAKEHAREILESNDAL